eukprot:5892261-Prymnesium_polylepis.2
MYVSPWIVYTPVSRDWGARVTKYSAPPRASGPCASTSAPPPSGWQRRRRARAAARGLMRYRVPTLAA